MGQTRLPPAHPVLIDTVAIAHQDALPILDQGEKGFLGAMGMNQVQRHRIGGHGPQPLQGVLVIPGRFINVAHRGVVRQDGNGLIMGPEGLRDPVDHLLDGSQAHGQGQDGVAEVLHKTLRVAMHPTQFANQRRQARAVAGGLFARDGGLAQLATPHTMGLVQEQVGDGHLHGGQLDHLMGVVQRGGAKLTMATGTRRRIHLLHVRGLKQGRSRTRMPLACPTFTG
jgi:hypothetical protein